jgi:hypothetical protein
MKYFINISEFVFPLVRERYLEWMQNVNRIVVRLKSTQPLTEMITRNLPGSKERKGLKADNLTVFSGPIV